MQHDLVLKKLNFEQLTPGSGKGGGGGGAGSWVGVWEQIIYFHPSPFVIPFNLICNMTLF